METIHAGAHNPLVHIMINNLYHTITNDEEQPPLFCHFAKDHHQQEIEHNPLTEHPTEHTEKEIMQ